MSHQRTRVMGIGCHVVRIPTDPQGCFITFVAAKSHKARHLSFRRLIHHSPIPPQVAVAGTFFDNRTHAPTGEIIVDRKRIDFGGIGDAFSIYPDKHATITAVPLNRTMKMGKLRNALRSGPRLVQDLTVRKDYRGQGFRDPNVIVSTARRCGVGVRKQGQEVILLVTPQSVSLRTFSQMFLTLGCHDALNLDGGGSLSLFHKNRVLIAPGRELTNIVVAF